MPERIVPVPQIEKERISPMTALAFERGKSLPPVMPQALSRKWFDEAWAEYLVETAKRRGGFEDPERAIPPEVLYKKIFLRF